MAAMSDPTRQTRGLSRSAEWCIALEPLHACATSSSSSSSPPPLALTLARRRHPPSRLALSSNPSGAGHPPSRPILSSDSSTDPNSQTRRRRSTGTRRRCYGCLGRLLSSPSPPSRPSVSCVTPSTERKRHPLRPSVAGGPPRRQRPRSDGGGSSGRPLLRTRWMSGSWARLRARRVAAECLLGSRKQAASPQGGGTRVMGVVTGGEGAHWRRGTGQRLRSGA